MAAAKKKTTKSEVEQAPETPVPAKAPKNDVGQAELQAKRDRATAAGVVRSEKE